MKSSIYIALLLCCWAISSWAAESRLTYIDLVNRLTDLEYLATVPAPGEQCAQWSSYDRASRYEAGKYVAWDANGDGDGFIRKEGDKFVFAEMQGPGVIWRIWSAAPKAGHVRIYLDGAAEPAIDLPFVGYFDRKNAPFTRPALVHTVARGWNNYVPIPYQKSCKIVADAGWGQYFQFTYGTFPAGTTVPTFKRELTSEESAALDRANERLANSGPSGAQRATGDKLTSKIVSAAAGKSATVAKLKGPRAITCLRVKMELPASPEDRDLLRELVLRIKWDGEQGWSVWSPLGDFFGTAPGMNVYSSCPAGVGKDGWWYCNWYMPFGKSAEIELLNEGKAKRNVSFEISDSPLQRPIAQLGRFHAKWHRDAFLPSEKERAIDWPFLKTEGRGRFAGVMLHICNPRGSWWGEGDEKFFVDGEKFPSTFGTGSEDYFGYAWCDPTLFQNAFHNQTHNDGNNKGHVSVNRWQIADAVPFQRGFEGDIEKYYPNKRPTLYAAVAYWYLAPGGRDPYPAIPVNERVGYCPEVKATRVSGALEGERLKVLSKTGGNPQEQELSNFSGQWSNDAHLWWTEAKPGDKLEIAVPVTRSGRYSLGLQLTKAPDYGIVQLYWDGEKLGSPIDLYDPAVMPFGPLNFGDRTISSGEHKLTVELLGANEKAIKNFMFGLDYIKLDPQ